MPLTITGVILLASLPLIRFAFCRIAMAIRLKKVCKKVGAEMHFRSPFALFDRSLGTKNSLYIKTNGRVYSIRLVGFFFRMTRLRIYGPTQYSVKNYSLPVAGMVMLHAEETVKTKPPCDFNAFPTEASGEIQPCYLFSPCLLNICLREANRCRFQRVYFRPCIRIPLGNRRG